MSWSSPWSSTLTNDYGLTGSSNSETPPLYTSASSENNQSYPIRGDFSGDSAYYYNGKNWVATSGFAKMISENYQGTNPYGSGLYPRPL